MIAFELLGVLLPCEFFVLSWLFILSIHHMCEYVSYMAILWPGRPFALVWEWYMKIFHVQLCLPVWLLIVHIAMTIFGFHCLWTKSLLMLGTPKPGVLPALAILHAYGPTTFANPYAYVTHPCPVYLFYMHAWYYFLNNTYACDPAMAKWSANPLLFLTIHCIYVYILLLVAYVAHWSAYVHSYCSQLFPYMCSLYVLHWFCLCLSLQWSA